MLRYPGQGSYVALHFPRCCFTIFIAPVAALFDCENSRPFSQFNVSGIPRQLNFQICSHCSLTRLWYEMRSLLYAYV